jgi:PIN domain nuclease of toxin-antitoxin system
MRFLADTQSFIWFIEGDPKLSTDARTTIENIANTRLLSVASIWEMAIKVSIGKLVFNPPFATLIPGEIVRNSFDILDVSIPHIVQVASLTLHHRDPFDRMMIAQAIVERVPIVSADPAFDAYPIMRIW